MATRLRSVRGQVRVSLIICSKNRAGQLADCLAAVGDSDLAGIGAEIILVDNGSADLTREVMTGFASRYAGPSKVLTEGRAGLGRARNVGWRAAEGEVIAFTDDDCYVSKNYGRALLGSFKRVAPDYLGGSLLRWDPADVDYGITPSGRLHNVVSLDPGQFVDAGTVPGANMAFRRSVLEAIGGFDGCLGAGTRFRCEDADAVIRASLAGYRGAVCPEVAIYHHHRRQTPEDERALMRADDFARGALYAKTLRAGRLAAVRAWGRSALTERKYRRLIAEIHGALAYTSSRTGG